MSENKNNESLATTQSKRLSTIDFLSRSLAFLILLFLIYAAITSPDNIHATDFSGSIYIAGSMVKDGKASELYLEPSATTSPFNDYAHKQLLHMPQYARTIFLYPPLVAFVTQPLSCLSPHAAYIFWQMLSIFALLLSCVFIASTTKQRWNTYFCMSLLYAPIFQHFFAGQLDLVFVLLPLSAGYFMLMKGHSFAGGLAWSLIFLKPQFLPVVLLLIAYQLMTKHWINIIGFIIGMVGLLLGNIFCLGPSICQNWISSLMQGAILEDYLYTKGSYMVSSWPMAVLERLPADHKAVLQMAVYLLIMIIAVNALFICKQLAKGADNKNKIVVPFVLGIFVLPMVSRHLLFYDLSVLVIGGMLIFGSPIFNANKKLIRDLVATWLFIDLYLIVFGFNNIKNIASPILITILIWFYIRLVLEVQRIIKELKPSLH